MKIIDKLLRVKSRFGLWLLVNGFVSHCFSLTIPSLIPIGILLVSKTAKNRYTLEQSIHVFEHYHYTTILKQGGCNKNFNSRSLTKIKGEILVRALL
ncbi:hypothetical protein HpBT0162_12530 [Helicobacter pylori]